ncbi:hypothetical protein GTO27_00670 [Candidatus Bathyarchaeota archaeon]|nr:hypothetical protein [Candidatus Bathyarchaeota archaeon]
MRLKAVSGILLILLLLIGKQGLTSAVVPTETTPSDPPIHIHLTWQNETNTTITVTWQTNSPTSGDIILYDSVSRGGAPSDYSCRTKGVNYTYSGSSGWIHVVELTGLNPSTIYYFICGGDTGGWSGERAFRTAPSTSSDTRFVVGGDSRTNWTERERISMSMAKFSPAFAMHSGDMVNDGIVQSQWDRWFTDVDTHWIGEDNLTIPIIPTLGNHEYPQYTQKYFHQFALPGNERWFSYDWGPHIHIICLDSESPASGAQRDWLENDLATHANYTWKFVNFHRPPFVSGAHSPWTPARTHWVPLFDKYHVDIVFNGHEHNYQRTYALNWTASQVDPQDYSDGTMYIVTGGWGAPLYSPEPIWYMARQNITYHFCLIDVFNNGTLHLQAKDNQGHTFDEVTIHKYARVLTIASSPVTGVSLTINGTTQATPYTGLLPKGNYVLEMPENHNEYVWSHWLEDGNVNRTKVVIMDTDIALTGLFRHFCDLDKNGCVDMRDIAVAASAFGSYPSHPRWNPNADMNKDNQVDMKDIVNIARNFGKDD